MAEAATRAALVENGLDDRVELDSAGIGAWHVGNPPDARMRAAGRAAGLAIDGTARQVSGHEVADWDLVLAMDRSNLADLRGMAAPELHDRIRLFRTFDPDADSDEVPDPYYGGPEGFQHALDLIEGASEGLLQEIRERHLGG